MATFSRTDTLATAICSALNADADLSAYNFASRKKPYNRDTFFVPGGWVVPVASAAVPFENSTDERQYRFLVVIANQTDGDLVGGMATHLAAMERIEDIFENKSHGFLPASLRVTAQAAFDQAATDGKIAQSKIQATRITTTDPFVDAAFKNGIDASAVYITVLVKKERFDSRGL